MGPVTANAHSIEHPPHSPSSTPPGTESAIPPPPSFQPSNTPQHSARNCTQSAPDEPPPSEDLFLSSADHSSHDNIPLLSTSEPTLTNSLVDEEDADDRTHLIHKPRYEGADTRLSTDFSADTEHFAGLTSKLTRKCTTPVSSRATFVEEFRRAATRATSVGGGYIELQELTRSPVSCPTLDGVNGEAQHRPSLRGCALGILGRENPLRVALFRLLIHPYAEPTILTLILINAATLVVQSSRTFLLPPDQVTITVRGYFHAWEDFVIFALFIIFTIETFGRICLTGLFLDPDVRTSSLFSFSSISSVFGNGQNSLSLPPQTRTHLSPPRRTQTASIRPGSLSRGSTWSSTLSSTLDSTLNDFVASVQKAFSIPESSHAWPDAPAAGSADAPLPPKSDESDDAPLSLPFQLDIKNAQSKIERNIPYLRQGWGRIDSIAIIGFWVSFALATTGRERGAQHIGIFRALSVLRTARLLDVTNRTATILRSLKFARPLLANVIYFVIFAMVLFAVIGVQSFKTSLLRNCALLPVLGGEAVQLNQTCGGHINATTLARSPYLFSDGTPASITKGFICPLGQVCQEGINPYNGLESFDTVYHAALQIVVLASASSWAPVMYQIMASEYDIAAAFFIFGVLVLNFWLFNLLIAVITNSFSAIRAGTEKSAFGTESTELSIEGGWFVVTGHPDGSSRFKLWWSYTKWFWVALALTSLVVQATANTAMSELHRDIIDVTEFAVTLAFDVEILVRISLEFPDWRQFFVHFHNWLDLIVAIACSIIQIPPIHNSRAYPWLTFFQLSRFFRVLLAIPRIQRLMLAVFGSLNGLANMILFLILVTFLAALFALQIIQGDMPGAITLNFGQLFNSFLGAYQILSKDSWTTLLYNAAMAEQSFDQPITVITFLCCWLFFSNFIVMQMFIAVINENFDAAEEDKRKKPEKRQSQVLNEIWGNFLSKLNPARWLQQRSLAPHAENPSLASDAPEAGAVQQNTTAMLHDWAEGRILRRATLSSTKSLRQTWNPFRLLHAFFTEGRDDELHQELYLALFDSKTDEVADEYTVAKFFDLLIAKLRTVPFDLQDRHRHETKKQIEKCPTYDRTLGIFSQGNSLRHLCQTIVRPSGGERIKGTQPSHFATTLFQLALFLAVSGNIVTAAISTPIYRHQYHLAHGITRTAWFHITDATFGLILVVEFLIKIVADGILFTPNAYIRSTWNIFDFVVMVGVLVNVTVTLAFVVGLSRFIRALKALQVLRLMTLIDRMRNTFEDLLLANFVRVFDAAALAMLYLIPFSVWATNVFAGLVNQCNDSSVDGIRDCADEYINRIDGKNYGFPVPRVWDYPSPSTTFCFDNFHSSLLILFEIVSQTGWVNVMSVAMSITGKGLQPRTNASQANAIFFVVYNLLGAVVVVTLFVSIIIRNSPSRTGAPYLTAPQREWADLLKLIKRLKPSKWPPAPEKGGRFKLWCYERARHKRVWWPRMMTLLFAVQMIVLMTQAFSAQTAGDWHNIVTLVISSIYIVDVLIHLYGLGWRFFFIKGWNIFDVIVASGSFVTTLLVHFYPNSFTIQLLQKLFLVSMSFKLVHKVAVLNHLFKSGVASLPEILKLLALWFILFLFFAIVYVEVFGLTKWYSAENSYQNYQTMGSALLMLVSLSTGGGWNQFMHDYALEYPQCTTGSDSFHRTDCGSKPWAYTLFIAWNILSMYLFTSMFVGVIVRSFAYVFQSSHGVLEFMTRRGGRVFKEAWDKCVNKESGLLERIQVAPFLAKLSGILEVRIHATKYSSSDMPEASRDDTTNDDVKSVTYSLKLKRDEETQNRREVYMKIYHEANLMCYRPDKKGITFTEMLELLAHYKLVKDDEALIQKELDSRKAIRELVADLVKLDKSLSWMKRKILRRRYLLRLKGPHGTSQGTPSNVGDATGGASPSKTVAPQDISSPSGSSGGEGRRFEHDSASMTSSSKTLVESPQLMAREETGIRDDLEDNPHTLPSPPGQPEEETRLLQAHETHD